VTPVRLDDILDATRSRIARLRGQAGEVVAAAETAPRPPAWRDAFAGNAVGLIAEVKRRSPSAGVIAPGLDPTHLARAYVAGGAVAVSVLTEEPHFGGSLEDLRMVRAAVATPVLRKDFIVDPLQVYESRAAGASAVLLIVRALHREALRDLAALAAELGLARLIEVHTAAELEVAVSLDPEAIGVNSRDLDTFVVDPEAMRPLLGGIPRPILAVAESGMRSRADVVRVAGWGADAVLVGTALAGAASPQDAAAGLVGVPRDNRARTVLPAGGR
jgi:indole-3-glycerol phosphate synthase